MEHYTSLIPAISKNIPQNFTNLSLPFRHRRRQGRRVRISKQNTSCIVSFSLFLEAS